MPFVTRSVCSRSRAKTGKGFVNSLINNLPFELHIPRYQYCGPGTKVKKRVARGDKGINPLDAACKRHDIAYLQNKDDLSARHRADYELEQSAWKRVKSNDSSAGEKSAAWLVTNMMKAKQRFGMGVLPPTMKSNKKVVKPNSDGKRKRLKKVSFGTAFRRPIRAEILKKIGGEKMVQKNIVEASKIAVAAARNLLKTAGGKRKVRTPRIIPIPKTGGLLPLIPIFAGLSALGSLAGGVASIVRTIKGVKKANAGKTGATLQLSSKSGCGLYLKPYRSGMGLFMNRMNSKN